MPTVTSTPAPTATAPAGDPALLAVWRLSSSWTGGYVANLDVTALRRLILVRQLEGPERDVDRQLLGRHMHGSREGLRYLHRRGLGDEAHGGQKVTVGLHVAVLKAPIDPVLNIK